ncbi:MAG TPA: glycosyltransferase family 4 protein [Terriglobales bacterium]|jgi:glycosyltransferase involved in cell wall biosynthesis
MKRVLIIEAQIKQYRLPFYRKLVETFANRDIELRVGYSDPPPSERSRRDNCDLPVDYRIKVKGYWLLHEKLLIQPLFRAALRADLVIIDQGNKYLLNHFLLPLSRMGIRRVAFWGLGENRQDGKIWMSEWYRRKTIAWVSWWFAYTQGTARYLIANGVPISKITSVNNAVDTHEIREHIAGVSGDERITLRARLGIPAPAIVGIFCGMLDRVKSVPFLVESGKLIKARMPDFHLILVGGGPDQASIESLVQGLSWVHFTGPRFAKDKSDLIAISDAFLMPGRVGLAILDAFAGGLPLLSTRLKIHGPEMEYLDEGVNGLLSEPDISAFAAMTASVLSDRQALARLQRGACESGAKYTVENMAANFKSGIECCLGLQNHLTAHTAQESRN